MECCFILSSRVQKVLPPVVAPPLSASVLRNSVAANHCVATGNNGCCTLLLWVNQNLTALVLGSEPALRCSFNGSSLGCKRLLCRPFVCGNRLHNAISQGSLRCSLAAVQTRVPDCYFEVGITIVKGALCAFARPQPGMLSENKPAERASFALKQMKSDGETSQKLG